MMKRNGVVINSTVKVSECKPHPENYQRHDDAQIADLRESLRQFGQVRSIVVQRNGHGYIVVAGNGLHEAARREGLKTLRADVVPASWSKTKVLAYLAADNELARRGTADEAQLAALVARIHETEGETLAMLAAGERRAMDRLLALARNGDGQADAEPQIDRAEELNRKWQVKPGDLWRIGEHRLLCGDSTRREDVERAMGGEKASLCHADPPYGMGKEKDGIENDNLYREKLDAFQMAWWSSCRTLLDDNASVYIWGNAENLWRLWYCGGLRDSERMTIRNEITWEKQGAQGIASEMHRMYPTTSERCLFFMLGEQGFSNNADNYWEGWDSVVDYLEKSRQMMGWSIKDTKRIAGHSEGSGCHWFDKSQWMMPTEETYKKWQSAAHCDAFKREYDDLKREYDDLKREWYATRAYFDNSHDNMTDVWQFGRVTGIERWGHSTPKPIELVMRAVKSSSPHESAVYIPFSGSGSDFVACQNLNRRGRGIEINPAYCAVILQRMADAFPGIEIERIEYGEAKHKARGNGKAAR